MKAVILDMDGLMVDTEPLYKTAWQTAARDLGYDLHDERYTKLVGRTTEAGEQVLIAEFGAAFPLEAFRGLWPGLWRLEARRGGIHRKPGLTELLAFIGGAGLRVAVATSSEEVYTRPTLEGAGLADHFEVVVTGDQVPNGKPAPDIYLEAARRLAVSPSDCVAFEDSEAGIIAVSRAGMTGVLVPHWPASAEAQRVAYRVVESLHAARGVLASLLTPAG